MLAAIDTSQLLGDTTTFVQDHPLPAYAGGAVLILVLIGLLYFMSLRRGDKPPKAPKPRKKSSGGSFRMRRRDGESAPEKPPEIGTRGGIVTKGGSFRLKRGGDDEPAHSTGEECRE